MQAYCTSWPRKHCTDYTLHVQTQDDTSHAPSPTSNQANRSSRIGEGWQPEIVDGVVPTKHQFDPCHAAGTPETCSLSRQGSGLADRPASLESSACQPHTLFSDETPHKLQTVVVDNAQEPVLNSIDAASNDAGAGQKGGTACQYLIGPGRRRTFDIEAAKEPQASADCTRYADQVQQADNNCPVCTS